MKPGRRPVPTNLRVLRGNPGKRPLPKNEMQPRVEDGIPDPPAHLEGTAQEEWHRIAQELHRLGCLTVVDYAVLGAYCTAFQKWVEIEEMLEEIRNASPKHRATLVTGPAGVKINPLIKASLNAAAEMVRIAGEFGFSPAARARIAMGVDGREDFGKFQGLIGCA
jgi:P27 family predicted phage terminase small subunit